MIRTLNRLRKIFSGYIRRHSKRRGNFQFVSPYMIFHIQAKFFSYPACNPDINNSIEETMHLLGSAKNAGRLIDSIAQLKAGKVQFQELVVNEKQKSRKQTTG